MECFLNVTLTYHYVIAVAIFAVIVIGGMVFFAWRVRR